MIQGIDIFPTTIARGYNSLDEIFVFTDLSGHKSQTPQLNFFNAYRIKPFSIERDDGGALNGAILSKPGVFADNSISAVNQGRLVYQLNGYYNAQKVLEHNIAGIQVTIKLHASGDATTLIYNKRFAFDLPSATNQGQQNFDPGSSNLKIVQNKIKFATTSSDLLGRIAAGRGTITTVNELQHSNNEVSQNLEFGRNFENLNNAFLGPRALSDLTEHYMKCNKRIPELLGVNYSFIPAPLDFLSLNYTNSGEIKNKLEPMVEALTRQPYINAVVDEMAGIAGQGSAQSYAEYDLIVNHANVLSSVGRDNIEPRDYMDHNQMVAGARSTRDKKISNQLLNAIMSISPGQRNNYRIAQSSFFSDYYRFNAMIELDIEEVMDNPIGDALSVHITPLHKIKRAERGRKIETVPDNTKKVAFSLHPFGDYKAKVHRAVVPPTIRVLKNILGQITLKIIRNDPCPLPITVYRQYYNPSSGEYSDLKYISAADPANDNFGNGYYDTIVDNNVENVHPFKVIYRTRYEGIENPNPNMRAQAGATASIVIPGIPYDIDPAGLIDSAVYERRDCAIVATNHSDHVLIGLFNLPRDATSIAVLRHKIDVGSVGASAIGSRSQNKVVARYRGDADTDFPSELFFRDNDPTDGKVNRGDFDNNAYYVYKLEIKTPTRQYIAPEEEIVRRIRPKFAYQIGTALDIAFEGNTVLKFRPFVNRNVADLEFTLQSELARLITDYGLTINLPNFPDNIQDEARRSLDNLHYFEVETVNLRTGYRSSVGFTPALNMDGEGITLPQFADDTMIIAHHCVVANGYLNPDRRISGVDNVNASVSTIEQRDVYNQDRPLGEAPPVGTEVADNGSTSLYGGSLHTGLISTFMHRFGAIPINRDLLSQEQQNSAGGVFAMGRTGLTATSIYRTESGFGPDIPNIDDLFGTEVLEAKVHSSGRAEIVWNVRGRIIAPPPGVNNVNTFNVPMSDYIDYFIVSCYLNGNQFVLGTVDCVFAITTNTRALDGVGDEKFYFIDDKMPNEIGARIYAITAVGYDPAKTSTKYVNATGLSISNLSSVPSQLLSNNDQFGSA